MKKLKKMIYFTLGIVAVLAVTVLLVLQHPDFGRTPTGKRMERIKLITLFYSLIFPCDNLRRISYFPILNRLGLMPLRREKNLLKDGESAKWR